MKRVTHWKGLLHHVRGGTPTPGRPPTNLCGGSGMRFAGQTHFRAEAQMRDF